MAIGLQTTHPRRWQWQYQRHLERGHAQQVTDAENQRIELEVLGDHQQREEAAAVQQRLAQPEQSQQ